MQTLRLIAIAALIFGVAACSKGPEIASRNAPFEVTPPVGAALPAGLPNNGAANPLAMTVTGIKIRVPRTLSVSEANSYYPRADIVWRGDPIGDRHAQVSAIFNEGFAAGTKDMQGDTDVIIDVEVVRFHSLTEKARYSIGGVHNIKFNITLYRASTGEALAPTRGVEADLPAYGGDEAIEAERQGQTQRVRVTNFLAQVIRQEMSRYISG